MPKHNIPSDFRAAQIGGDAVAGAIQAAQRNGTAVVRHTEPGAMGRSRTDHRPAAERGEWWGDLKPSIETTRQTIARIERERVVPKALERPCYDHEAEIGVACWGTPRTKVTGVCQARVSRARLEEWVGR